MTNYSSSTKAHAHFDIAIIGAGLAGMMLAMELVRDTATAGKKILLLDKAFQEYAPRTWCFWEEGSSCWDSLTARTWQQAEFFSQKEHLVTSLAPYAYKMIHAEALRAQAWKWMARYPAITVEELAADSLQESAALVTIYTPLGCYTASYVFDSRLPADTLQQYKGTVLYQQFSGWYVQSDKPVFDPHTARLMDFRMDQQEAVAFCYLLPLDACQALVEYTLFAATLQPHDSLEQALRAYLQQHYPGVSMNIRSKEEGVIPMADFPVPHSGARIIPIGTAGGCTKPSSGYTFTFVRQHTAAIMAALRRGEAPCAFQQLLPARFRFYDRVLLRIIKQYPCKGAAIFFRLFKKNTAPAVFRFMNNASSLKEELALFCTLPVWLFLGAALQEARKTIAARLNAGK